jgi:nucleoside-diphosphate-sugar epimerase
MNVVFGTGQVGRALVAHLAGSGRTVRAVSLHRPAALADGVDWRPADASDPEAASDAAKGASVVYQCLNAPYTRWPKCFPALQAGVLICRRTSRGTVGEPRERVRVRTDRR